MTRQSDKSKAAARGLLVALLGLVAPALMAQPGSNSPNQFGDRQSGQWGDPAQGHFGNPAVGDFDKNQIKAPPPGAKPLGKVYTGKVSEDPPYVTLPTPADAAPATPVEPAKPAEAAKPAKKPAKKKRVVKKKATG